LCETFNALFVTTEALQSWVALTADPGDAVDHSTTAGDTLLPSLVSRSRIWESGVIACSLITHWILFPAAAYSSQPSAAGTLEIAQPGDPSLNGLQDSIAQMKHALAAKELKQPVSGLSLARSFEKLASLYEQAGQFNEAELAYLKAFEIIEKTHGTDHQAVIPIADSLGSLYFHLNRYDDSEFYIKKWISASVRNLPAQRGNLAMALNNLGLLYKAEGRGPEAIAMLQSSLENASLAPEVSRPHLGTIANRLAVFCIDEGRRDDAATYFKTAAAALEEGGAAYLGSAAAVLQNLTLLYIGQKRYADAVETGLKTLSLIAQTNGQDQGLLYEGLVTLAAAYSEDRRPGEAEPLLMMAADTASREFPQSDPRYASACNNLGLIYKAMGRPADSAIWFERALKAGEIAYGADHPWIASAALGLGVAYAELKDPAKAEAYFKQAIAIGSRRLGPDHLLVAAALFDLGILYAKERRFGDAGAVLQQAVAIRLQKLEADNPAVREAQAILAWVQRASAEQEEKPEGAQKVSANQGAPLR